jgi:transcriptional regulator with XRE-family HTH domain
VSKYAKFVGRVRKSVDYWAQVAMRDFVRDLIRRMDRENMSQTKLAEVIGASPAYVSKIMRGDANFTLETMTKLALATGGRLRVQIVEGAMNLGDATLTEGRWHVEHSSRTTAFKVTQRHITLTSAVAAANDVRMDRPVPTTTGASEELPAREAAVA